ncbi:MAG TPA: glycoside hydrolase [Verrucomicrobiae bacterium]|nr:glycoside hydrolase [Verrucomicrobiae bacterium]
MKNHLGPCRTLWPFALIAVSALAAAAENDGARLAKDATTGDTRLIDQRAGVTWELGKVPDARLAPDGTSIIIDATPPEKESVRLLDHALSITPADGGFALVPVREGLLIPANGPAEFSRRFPTSGYEGCHLNMLGFLKGGAALLMTWDDPYVAPELAKTKDGLACSVHVRRPPHAKGLTPTSVTLTALGKGDWNTLAAAYRQVATAKGLAITLREKAKRNAETEKLLGASNAKLWTCLNRRRNEESTADESVTVHWTFDEAAQIAEHLKRDIGFDRCLFILGGWTEGGYDCRHPDALPANSECGGNAALGEATRRIKALGYLACFHDNYQDMYRDAKSWDPGCIQKKADGSPMAGGRWLGGRAWLVCAPETVRLASRPQNLPEVRRLFGPQAYFIDTTFAVDPQECFDAKHPLARADDIRWKQKLADYSRDVFGLFGSECGREWAIPHSDFFEGLSGVSGRYFHNLDASSLGATVVPLFEMVYHDCEVVFGKYGYDPEGAAEYVAHHALCARTLNYHSFPNHLYWKGPAAVPTPEVKARPSIASVEPIGPRKFRIKYRWRVEADCEGDWRTFVHFGKGEPVPFQNDHVPARPVSGWRTGEVIEEGPFDVTVPEKYTAGTADVFVGLCRNSHGAERAKLPGSGADRRVRVGRLRLAPTIALESTETPAIIGDMGCFARADGGWAEGLCLTDRFLKNTHEILGPLAEATSHARLTRLDFLTPDRGVRRATYAEGEATVATVTVNFGAAEYRANSIIGGEVTLPPFGILIESPRFVAFHAKSWSGRMYPKPVLFAIRCDDHRTRIFHGFGDPSLTWRCKELTVPRELEIPQ